MIKITNGQASALSAQIIADLFADPARQFPVADAFHLSDAIQLIQARVPAYKKQLRKIIEDNGGMIDAKGLISYADDEGAEIAQKQIDQLNAIEIEIAVDPVAISSQWPKLNLAEATILRPLLNGGISSSKKI